MKPRKVLLLAADAKSRSVLPPSLSNESPDLALEVFGRINEALERLSTETFDAAVCCVDRSDELSFLVRLKKRRPDLPVVVLSRVSERGFEALAQSLGAATVVRKTAGLGATSKALAIALQARALLKETAIHYRRTAELTRDLRELARVNRKLIGEALGMVASEQRLFLILIVEDDPDQALLLIRALARAKLPPFLRSVASIDEAKAYLSGTGKYHDREAFPFPALVITDLNLPPHTGMELLEWMRSRQETRQAGVIMLTSSDDEADMNEAYSAGANLYLVKRLDTKEIVEVVREVYGRFARLKSDSEGY